MSQTIAIIGGDLRIVKLAEMLAEDHIIIKTYALEKAESLKKRKEIQICSSIEEALKGVKNVIGPIPLSSNGLQINTPFSETTITVQELANQLNEKRFIAGNIKKEFYTLASQANVIDLLNREELVVLNTIATAEGAIQIAMQETIRTIHGSNVLVLGFGRVGKILANMLKGIGANVYCEARRNVDFAWIKAYDYKMIELKKMKENLNEFDIVMNTIPALILGKEEISQLKKDCIIIDLASNPGGVDKIAAEAQGIKSIWALALPGKVAPLTSAEFIKETIDNILKENEIEKEEEI